MLKPIQKDDFSKLIEHSRVLACDNDGNPKVYLRPDHQIIKCFPVKNRLKRMIGSHLKRFVKITKKLESAKINTVKPEKTYYCKSLRLECLSYPHITGKTLRDCANAGEFNLLTAYAQFLGQLHQKNIYFRGGHLGNIIVTGKGFALIDVTNTKFKVSVRRRIKNLKYILNYGNDKTVFNHYGKENFVRKYLDASDLSTREKEKIKAAFQA